MTAGADITIEVPYVLRTYCGGAAKLTFPAKTIRDALQELERRYPALHRNVCDETGAVRRHINVFLNSSHMRDRNGIDSELQSGDVLIILPAVSGG